MTVLSVLLANPMQTVARTRITHRQPALLVDPAEALGTFDKVQGWIDADKTPTDENLPEGAVGVWVGLRWSGRLIASASDIDADNLQNPSTRALTGSVRRAMSMARVRARGQGDAIEQSDREDQFLSSPRRAIELELAYNPIRIRATSLDSVLTQVNPGMDGILMRYDGGSYAAFPAEMLAQDQTPANAMLGLLTVAGVDIKSVDAQIADSRLRLWTFQTWHLAQDMRNGPPVFLTRGSRNVPLESMNTAAVRECAAAAARYLMAHTYAPPTTQDSDTGSQARRDKAPLVLLGAYLPSVDQHAATDATCYEQALAVLALGRFARDVATGQEQREQAIDTAARLFEGLTIDVPGRLSALSDSRATALIVIAWNELQELRGHAVTDALYRDALTRVALGYTQAGGFADGLSPLSRAMIAAAMGSRTAANAAWESTAPEVQVMLWPWIAWADLALAGDSGDVPDAALLQTLRDRVFRTQVGADPMSKFDEDQAGAFQFRPGDLPGWESARITAALAAMLGNPVLTPQGQRINEILTLQSAMRFLSQLQLREADTYRLRSPTSAIGGVRMNLVSQRVLPEATAMTLLAGTQFLNSLDRIAEPRVSTQGDRR